MWETKYAGVVRMKRWVLLFVSWQQGLGRGMIYWWNDQMFEGRLGTYWCERTFCTSSLFLLGPGHWQETYMPMIRPDQMGPRMGGNRS